MHCFSVTNYILTSPITEITIDHNKNPCKLNMGTPGGHQKLKFECLRVSNQVPVSETNRKHLTFLYKKVIRKSSRLNSQYQPAIDIIILLMGSGGALLDGENTTVPIPGFLFDMNVLFQNVISRFMHENATGCDVLDEYSLKGMMSYAPDFNPNNRKSPLSRPDFMIKKDNEIIAILDAKYRDLWINRLPREMLYQLGLCCKKYHMW